MRVLVALMLVAPIVSLRIRPSVAIVVLFYGFSVRLRSTPRKK